MGEAETPRAALTDSQIDEIVSLYARGAGEPIGALAKAYGVAPVAVTNALRRRNELQSQQESESMSDGGEQLVGIDMAAIMASPEMQGLIAQAVADRLASMAGNPAAEAPMTPAGGDATANFAGMMSRMFEVLSMQQPGYRKPLPPDEIERRMAGKVEMDALLSRYRMEWERNPSAALPKWRVGEKGFFECVNAVELREGDVFETYLPPVEDFEPLNAEAEAVHAAMMQHLGEATLDIGEQVKNAQAEANRPIIVPGAIQPTAMPKGPMRIIERATASTEPAKRKRQLGTIVDEPRQVVGGHSSDPQGPVYQAA